MFTLEWSLLIDGIEKTVAPSTVSTELRHICETYRSRGVNATFDADFEADLEFDPVSPATTSYVRAPGDLATVCDNIDVFADTGLGYAIDPVTGGAIFSEEFPAQPGCYDIRLIAREYDALRSEYNVVADPAFGNDVLPTHIANVDDAELCRDTNGIWSIAGKKLLPEHQDPIIVVPATTAGNPNFIDYTTRPLIWDDAKSRTTMEGRLRINYLVEVSTP